MRTEFIYCCEICNKHYYDEEDALDCEKSHMFPDTKQKYNIGDLLHYYDEDNETDVYFILEDGMEVYWDASYGWWIYVHREIDIPEDCIELEMTAKEYTKRIADIKAKLEGSNCYDISVAVDSTKPKFCISAYWSKTDRWR